MRKLIALFIGLLFAAPSFAEWHTLTQVTKVTTFGSMFFVKGTNPTGHACTDYVSFYGTLYADGTYMREMYALALMAQATSKGLVCHVYTQNSSGVCKMENCYMQ